MAVAFGIQMLTSSAAFADVCDPTASDYDPTQCSTSGSGSGAPGGASGGGSSNGAGTVPIDGGASLLIAGGFAYGAKRYRALKAKKA